MEFEFGEEILEAGEQTAAEEAAARGDVVEEETGETGEDAGSAGGDDQADGDQDRDGGEEEGQGDDAGEGDESGKDDGKGQVQAQGKGDGEQDDEHREEDPVPAARFREVIKQRNEVRDQIRAIQEQNKVLLQTLETVQKSGGKTQDGQQGQQKAQGDQGADRFKDFNFSEKMSAYNDAVIDGDDKAAKELFSEILDYQNHMTEQRVVATIQNFNRTKETEANRSLAVEIVNRHSDELEAEPDLADDMAYYRARYERQGMPIKEALLAAEKKVFGEAKASAADDDGDDAGRGEDVRDKRKRQAIERNAVAAQNQPPLPTGGRGQRARTMPKNALEMSDDEFDKLPEEERRKLRGDFV